jgi:hypothetical protein
MIAVRSVDGVHCEVKKFPDVARNVEDTISMYFHFDRWVEAMMEGLEKARKAAS